MTALLEDAAGRRATPGQLVDAAGRQRMLNQEIAKRRLAAALGHEVDFRPPVGWLRDAAAALASGGILALGGQMVLAPEPPTDRIRAAAEKQYALAHSLSVFDENAELDVPRFLRETTEFHDVAQATVTAYTAWSREVDEEHARRLAGSLSDLTSLTEVTESGIVHVSQICADLVPAAGGLKSVAKRSSEIGARVFDTSGKLASLSSSTAEASSRLARSLGVLHEIAEQTAQVAQAGSQSVASTEAQMEELKRFSREIGRISRQIIDVATNTRLLALNASIEASRAGVCGGSFGVVATEFKELADVTARASASMEVLANGLHTSVREATEVTDRLKDAVDALSNYSKCTAAASSEQASALKAGEEAASDVRDEAKGLERLAAELRAAAVDTERSSDEITSGIEVLSKTATSLRNDVERRRGV